MILIKNIILFYNLFINNNNKGRKKKKKIFFLYGNLLPTTANYLTAQRKQPIDEDKAKPNGELDYG